MVPLRRNLVPLEFRELASTFRAFALAVPSAFFPFISSGFYSNVILRRQGFLDHPISYRNTSHSFFSSGALLYLTPHKYFLFI